MDGVSRLGGGFGLGMKPMPVGGASVAGPGPGPPVASFPLVLDFAGEDYAGFALEDILQLSSALGNQAPAVDVVPGEGLRAIDTDPTSSTSATGDVAVEFLGDVLDLLLPGYAVVVEYAITAVSSGSFAVANCTCRVVTAVAPSGAPQWLCVANSTGFVTSGGPSMSGGDLTVYDYDAIYQTTGNSSNAEVLKLAALLRDDVLALSLNGGSVLQGDNPTAISQGLVGFSASATTNGDATSVSLTVSKITFYAPDAYDPADLPGLSS